MSQRLPPLTKDEYRRYGRHLALAEVGEDGQRRLKAGSVLVVGAGGRGSPAALYLAAAGVGRLTLCDFDLLETSNLQRQVLFTDADVGRPKVEAGGERLAALNPSIRIERVAERISQENAQALVAAHDVVVDGSDNFGTRYLVNDACVIAKKPYVYGSIHRFEGQASVFGMAGGPCYRCLFPEPPPEGLVPNCAQAGVLGALPGIVGSIQAAEALKILLGVGETLSGRLLLLDLLAGSFREVRLRRDPACAVCGDRPTITRALETVGPGCPAVPTIEPDALHALLAGGAPPVLLDVREAWEFDAGALPGARHAPLAQTTSIAESAPADAEIVVYCSVGPRGERAVELLRAAGRERVRNLRGGMAAWRERFASA
jgi:molybdopterin/thiamine biosynthesis adenylyltransferase/rhodanese-related sulfurtransferase